MAVYSFKSALLILALVLLEFAVLVPSARSYTYSTLNELRVQVVLENGVPLPNATVELSPRLYGFFDEKDLAIAYTNENGTAEFYNVTVADYRDSYAFWLNIKYSVYGRLYKDPIRVRIPKNSYKYYEYRVVLPYTILQVNYTVLDEYRNSLNCSFQLLYNNQLIAEGRAVNGVIAINGTTYSEVGSSYQLLLIGDTNLTYRLEIEYAGETRSYPILKKNMSGYIILDLYPPRVDWWVTVKRSIMYWVNIYLNITDGVNSDKVNITVEIDDQPVPLDRNRNCNLLDGHYVCEVLISRSLSTKTVKISINVVDPGNHQYVNSTTIDLEKEAKRRTEPSPNNTGSQTQTPNELAGPNEPPANNTPSGAPTFRIPEQRSQTSVYYHFAGFIIAGFVLFMELKYRLYK